MNGEIAGEVVNSDGALIRRLLAGEPLALARAITAVENDGAEAAVILAAIQPHAGKAMVVGVTGPPGVGKSTLIDALVVELRRRGKKMAVLAIDPSSPLTGGAILGDRIRMGRHIDDPGVFVRSIASRGQLGGLSRTAGRVIQVMDAAGPDVILVETVGAGQSDVKIADVAHVKVVVSAPGLGDAVQAIKAGILEIADILVVNKCDQPQFEQTVQQLRAMLQLRKPDFAPVSIIATTATSGDGIPSLVDEIEKCRARPAGRSTAVTGGQFLRQRLAQRAAELLQVHIEATDDPTIGALCERVASGDLSEDAAAAELIRAFPGAHRGPTPVA